MFQRPFLTSLAQATIRDLFASADIRLGGERPWDIRVHDERLFRRILTGGTLAFGESYMDGWWDCDALDEMCCRAIRARLEERVRLNFHTALAVVTSLLFNLQNRSRARVVGKRHYDVGNDFFECMLDPAMQYSCAWFRGTDDLAQAQREKMDLICRKLGLQKGMHLLDIGCGWGGLAKHAAEHYGCRVVGITISEQQCSHASEFCRGLPVEIRLQDYRDLREPFDRIVSVGMLEHVGAKNYRHYMKTVFRCLHDGGVFLCQSIAGNWSSSCTDPWITRYIFAKSMLPSVAQVAKAAEKLFVLEDVQNFGADYERTLFAWEQNFARSWNHFNEPLWREVLSHVAFLSLELRGGISCQESPSLSVPFFKGWDKISPSSRCLALPRAGRSGLVKISSQGFRVGKECRGSARVPENHVFV